MLMDHSLVSHNAELCRHTSAPCHSYSPHTRDSLNYSMSVCVFPAAGTYAYAESTDAAPDSPFELLSSLLEARAPFLVSFWYHAYGADVGKLEVFESDGTARGETPLWSQEGATEESKCDYDIYTWNSSNSPVIVL